MAGLVDVGFDAATIAELTRFSRFPALLEAQLAIGLQQAGELVVRTAQENTWSAFDNPTGALAESISYTFSGPLSIDIVVGVPYGWRMEEGFHGTDSIGRVYDQDGKPYARPALLAVEDQVFAIMSEAMMEGSAQAGVSV